MEQQGSLDFWKLIKNDKDTATVELNGDLVINDISAIKDEILKMVELYTDLQINITNSSKIDLAGLQLLYSLKNFSDKKGTKTSFDIQLAEAWKTWLPFSGIEYLN
ncbi:hypothetical protein [Chondrinema litorale]|uniref:hypothetical protein n=1 Tax=Chondrinema litorale TaxID=2994555 RepID=UPI0025437793|nr:hypothetical protein [Chondrinema litorale]UZR99685.1 hypothetical protein OQ292_37985 [Chondrinema litorale]